MKLLEYIIISFKFYPIPFSPLFFSFVKMYSTEAPTGNGPPEEEETGDPKINEILRYVKKIDGRFSELENKTKRIEPLEKDVKTLKEELHEVKRELQLQKRELKSRNLVIFKIPDDETTNGNLRSITINILKKINSNLVDNEVVSINRVGRKPGNRPIVVSFASAHTKSSFFHLLEEVREAGISVSDDLSREERARRRELLEYFPRLREKGFTPKIRDGCILLGKDLFSLQQISTLLENSGQPNASVNMGNKIHHNMLRNTSNLFSVTPPPLDNRPSPSPVRQKQYVRAESSPYGSRGTPGKRRGAIEQGNTLDSFVIQSPLDKDNKSLPPTSTPMTPAPMTQD